MRPRLLAALCVLALAPAFVPALAPDASGAEAKAAGNTSRIISVGGAITEIVFALGLGDQVIAVDSTSLYPEAASKKPNVGYMRALAAEPILALEPNLVLAVEDAGPPPVLAQLREAGLDVARIPDHPTPEGVFDKITRVAAALGVPERGQALRARLDAELRGLAETMSRVPTKPRVLFLLSIGGAAPLAAGRDTSAAGIIALAGGVNAVDSFDGFKPLSPEATVASAPDVVLVTKRSWDLLGGANGILHRPEIAETPAGKNRRLIAMDGLLLLGFGPRTGQAIARLAEKLHPGLAFDAPHGAHAHQ